MLFSLISLSGKLIKIEQNVKASLCVFCFEYDHPLVQPPVLLM